MQISEALQQIATDLGLEYLRATDPQANEELERRTLDGLYIMIYNNLPDVDYVNGPFVNAIYPVEVDVMSLADWDNNTVETDEIQNTCRQYAEAIAQRLMSYNDTIVPPDNFRITSSDNVEKFDDILTGVQLQIDIQFTVNCDVPNNGIPYNLLFLSIITEAEAGEVNADETDGLSNKMSILVFDDVDADAVNQSAFWGAMTSGEYTIRLTDSTNASNTLDLQGTTRYNAIGDIDIFTLPIPVESFWTIASPPSGTLIYIEMV